MTQQPVRIDGEPITTDETTEIRSPYDGSLVGEVPRCSAAHVDRAVAAAARVMAEAPLPAWRRAAILDQAAELLADPDIAEDLAQTIAKEAAKPIATARVEVERCVSTFRFSATACRSLVGEVLPLDAAAASSRSSCWTVAASRQGGSTS